MQRLLQHYLAAPAERREATLAEMKESPERAFRAILKFKGPYPKGYPVLDVFPDLISPLLTEVLRAHPELVTGPGRDLAKLSDRDRWIVTEAASHLEDSELVSRVLQRLEDRSFGVIQLVVGQITRQPHLRRLEARPALERLLTRKSIAYFHDNLRQALALIDDAGTGSYPGK